MLQELLASGTLNLIYAGIIVISFLFAMLSLLGLEIGEALDFDADAGFDFISISPFALAMFGSAFGLVGLITRLWLEMDAMPSILWSLGAGLLFGALSQAFFLAVLSPSKSSHFSFREDTINREAQVALTIPQDGIGSVTYNNISGRVTLGARSVTGQPIEAGALVVIERLAGRVAMVRRLEDKPAGANQAEINQ
jgi:membrane protein implicated in regulation of membrane protease activity